MLIIKTCYELGWRGEGFSFRTPSCYPVAVGNWSRRWRPNSSWQPSRDSTSSASSWRHHHRIVTSLSGLSCTSSRRGWRRSSGVPRQRENLRTSLLRHSCRSKSGPSARAGRSLIKKKVKIKTRNEKLIIVFKKKIFLYIFLNKNRLKF